MRGAFREGDDVSQLETQNGEIAVGVAVDASN